MSSTNLVGSSLPGAPSTPSTKNNQGAVQGRSNWQKPLFIALIVIGLAVVSTGLASFGTHQWHWFAGGLSKLSLAEASVMIGIGSGFAALVLAVGIMKLISKEKKVPLKQKIVATQSTEDAVRLMTLMIKEEEIEKQLTPETFTFVLQANGNYTIFWKNKNGGFGLRGLDVSSRCLNSIKQTLENDRESLTFVETSPLPK